MQILSVSEIDELAKRLQTFVGGRLQEVLSTERDLILTFYKQGQTKYLWVDLPSKFPMALLLEALPGSIKKKNSPVQLFIKAHLVDKKLLAVERPQGFGRILRLYFSAESERYCLELRLFPHGQNILVQAGSKSISWNKAKELVEQEELGSTHQRAADEILAEWLGERWPKSDKLKVESSEAMLQKVFEKKRATLKKIEEELAAKLALPWREIGNWMVENQNLTVPSEWKTFVDQKQSLAQNIENCFSQAKVIEKKALGLKSRQDELRREIAELGSVENADDYWQEIKAKSVNRLDQNKSRTQQSISARILDLGEGLIAYWGKSGADNLKLLREARAWDVWVHLKDFPGSHAILRRQKNYDIKDSQFKQIGDKLVEVSLGKRAGVGDKFLLLIAECRHVRPIKGDRLGRVTYREEKSFPFRFRQK